MRTLRKSKRIRKNCTPGKASGKRKQGIHVEYNLVGFIPVEELMKAEQA